MVYDPKEREKWLEEEKAKPGGELSKNVVKSERRNWFLTACIVAVYLVRKNLLKKGVKNG